MKIFRIISASLLFLQGSVSANGDELASEIASEANEILAAAHGSRSATPVNLWEYFLPLSPERVRSNDRSLHHRESSFGSIDSDFSFRSTNSHISLGSLNSIDSEITRISAFETAKQKLNAALERAIISKGSAPFPEVTNEDTEVKQAFLKVASAIQARDLKRELSPIEEQYLEARVDLVLAFVKAKVYGPDGAVITLEEQLTKGKLFEEAIQHPTVEKAYRKLLQAKRIIAERAAAALPEAAQNLKEALERVNVFVTDTDFKKGIDREVFEAANSHSEVKEALQTVVLAIAGKFQAEVLERPLTPAEERLEISILEVELAFADAKLPIPADLKRLITVSNEVLDRYPAIAKAHHEYLESRERYLAEQSVKRADPNPNPNPDEHPTPASKRARLS